jgi:hypothetical protein
MKLQNMELRNLYSSQNIFRIIKSREMKWEGHVACMRERQKLYSDLVGKLKERDHRKI